MKILVATDFSETAARAAALALAFARRAGDSLVLLHVSEPPSSRLEALATDARRWEHSLREKDRADLRAAADQARAQGVAVEERLELGVPSQVAAAVAKEMGARLIVIGSHGRSPMRWFLLGSVAQETLLVADRPVVVVRRGSRPEGVTAWATEDRPLRVTFAIDRSPGTAAAADWLRWLRQIGPVDVRLLHVFEPLSEALRLGLSATREDQSDLHAILERELRVFVGELPGPGSTSLILHAAAGRPGQAVAREAGAADTDLLRVGTHHRTRVQQMWLGSTAELALRHAEVPMVCVPSGTPVAEQPGQSNE